MVPPKILRTQIRRGANVGSYLIARLMIRLVWWQDVIGIGPRATAWLTSSLFPREIFPGAYRHLEAIYQRHQANEVTTDEGHDHDSRTEKPVSQASGQSDS